MKYVSHHESVNELAFVMENDKIRVTQHYDFFENIKLHTDTINTTAQKPPGFCTYFVFIISQNRLRCI